MTETPLTYMDYLSRGLLSNSELWSVQFIALVQLINTQPSGWMRTYTGRHVSVQLLVNQR